VTDGTVIILSVNGEGVVTKVANSHGSLMVNVIVSDLI